MMPRALIEFMQMSENPEVTANELGRCIEHDTGLMCELLRYVNSSAVGLRSKASTAQRAITILGIHRSKLILMTSAVQKSLKPKNLSNFDYDGFSACNIERALFAQQFADALHVDRDLAFAGGMLVDCLIPKLVAEHPKLYASYSASADSKPPLTDVEQGVMGWTHASAAAQIMLGWQFPDDLICCVALHHEVHQVLAERELRSTPVAAVALASLIPDPLTQVPGSSETLLQISRIIAKLDVPAMAITVAGQMEQLSVPLGKHVLATQRMRDALECVTA